MKVNFCAEGDHPERAGRQERGQQEPVGGGCRVHREQSDQDEEGFGGRDAESDRSGLDETVGLIFRKD